MTVGVWVCFWVLYCVPSVCLSVLVPVPHCLDDRGFVLLPKVWESYASCLVFVPQDCFGNSGSFVVPYKFLDCGVPVVAQWLTNPTRNHEVAGLIPGLAQWVNNPELP